MAIKTKKITKRNEKGPVRIDLIDHDHTDWHGVLASLDRSGVRDGLMMHDGYLSARQSLFIARAGKEVVGHLSFHIAPGAAQEDGGRGCVEARLDTLDVRPGFGNQEVKNLLVVAAKKRASLLRCVRLVGFNRA